jgi:hypothetical protein
MRVWSISGSSTCNELGSHLRRVSVSAALAAELTIAET